ncbi:MAG: hypothetical protein M3436_14165 [Pseudomonadota bacterium]|nr:hypothetical protein [Pseudomonadota bacterium]
MRPQSRVSRITLSPGYAFSVTVRQGVQIRTHVDCETRLSEMPGWKNGKAFKPVYPVDLEIVEVHRRTRWIAIRGARVSASVLGGANRPASCRQGWVRTLAITVGLGMAAMIVKVPPQ